MDRFELEGLARAKAANGKAYHEFIRQPTLSVGIYKLQTGAVDPQQPHTEDEVYHVLEGRAHIRVGTEDEPVQPGTTVFVAAGVEHRFHSIEEDLTVLVFFAPAEGTTSRGSDAS